MADNHELFNRAALYMLGKAYNGHPVPVTVPRADLLDAIAPMPGEDKDREAKERALASVVVGYTSSSLLLTTISQPCPN